MTGIPSATPRPMPRVIRNRLAGSVGTIVVLAAVLTAAGFALMAGVLGGIANENRQASELTDDAEALHLALLAEETFALSYTLASGDRVLEEFEEAADAEIDAYIRLAEVSARDPVLAGAIAAVREAATEWRESWAEPHIRAIADGEQVAGATAFEEGERLFAPARTALEELNVIAEDRREAASATLDATVGNLAVIIVPAIAGVATLIAVAGFWLTRSISGPLERLNRTARALVAGEEVTFVAERDDEIGSLARVLEQLRADLSERFAAATVAGDAATTFNQLSELTSYAQDEATLADAAVRVIQRVAPSPRGHVMLLNNSTNRLSVAAVWGEAGPPVGAVAAIDRPDRCPGIRRATAYIAADLSDPLAVRCPAYAAESGSVACIPMPALGGIVGVIHIERLEPNSFGTDAVQAAARTAEHVALALANGRLMRTMEGLANTDPLTGLRNARFFDTYFDQEFALAERDKDSIGLIMLDVDEFKQFNDRYGHPAGDEALRTIARTIRSVLRASDVVARYGGEEFIIGLHHAPLADAVEVAEKVRAAIEETVIEIGPGRYGRVTASLGVVATDAHRVDRKGLVSLADAALYRAKAAGRNRVETAPTSTTDLEVAARRRRADAGGEPVVLPVSDTEKRRRQRRRQASRPRAAGA